MNDYTYVYVLQNRQDPRKHYTGRTKDLHERLRRHNGGQVPHTAKAAPWDIRVAIAFPDEKRAIEFERYLKTHSGRVFASRHF